ncbi:MAG TPA: molybdopterin cofactor-binding domain-containing protein, partial [Thermoanaerobaculia bacterium]|nr:molybdopterin cofactor-binding domain-containing protein [Thermoanaerobaculia bacterium]
MSTRRDFLRLSALAGGGLLLGIRLDALAEGDAAAPFRPNAWVRIEPDGRIVLVVGKTEMGQGVRTSLAKILADELDVDLHAVTLEQASPGPDFQRLGTGGSSSLMGSWDPLRQAGAAARALLVGAAAARWGVEPGACRTELGRVLGPDARSATYGELAAAAARLPIPEDPPLRAPAERRWIGTSTKRLDGPAIVAGTATYGLDVRLPGMLRAVVARPPVLGGTTVAFDPEPALGVPGVRACFAIPSGVAVVASSTWSALAGREALEAEWRAGPNARFSSAEHLERLAAAAAEPGITTRRDGAGRSALATAERRLQAVYLYPFSAHGAIEPVCSTARVGNGRCEIWTPTQTPNAVQAYAANALGIDPAAVTVHVTLVGGGFGRRLGADFDLEAVEIARRLEAPVQLLWTRADDLVHGYFQAASAHRIEAGLDARGRVVAWDHRKASTPHNARRQPTAEQLASAEYLADSSWGVNDSPYHVPAFETSYRVVEAPVPIGPWRSVYAPSSVFARESFLDELAAESGRDPLELRLELLGAGDPSVPAIAEPGGVRMDRQRLRRVLETVAERAGWGKPLPAGRARGLAAEVFHTETYVAYVVEASLRSSPGPGELP